MRIPPGFNTVTPYFFVDDAARFIDFLVRGVGGVESADAALARAIAAGATKIMDIADPGMRRQRPMPLLPRSPCDESGLPAA
jgi:hypothetical protein